MKSITLKFSFILLLLTSIFNMHVTAQVHYITTTVDITIPPIVDIQISSGASLNFNFDTSTKLDNGLTLNNATTLTYCSNKAWFVTIQAATANFTGGPMAMPASVIQFRRNGTVSYTPLSNSPLSLYGSTGSKNIRGTSVIGVDLKVNPGYTYEPSSSYSIGITYTISNL